MLQPVTFLKTQVPNEEVEQMVEKDSLTFSRPPAEKQESLLRMRRSWPLAEKQDVLQEQVFVFCWPTVA